MEAATVNEKRICNNISDLLEKFERYQIVEYILVCLAVLCNEMITINYVFVVGDLDYRCLVNECEDANATAQFPSWWPDPNIDKCSKPVLRVGEEVCTNNSFTGELAACDRWIYESNNTVVAALNLACQPWNANLIGTIHNLSMLLSMVVAGWLSDRIGRKATLIFCITGGIIGNFKTLATSYNVYAIIELLEATVTGGTNTAAVVLLLEIVGKKHRILSGVIFAYAVYLSESLFACIAMFVPYWKTLIYIINGPCIFFLVYIFFINESPRWLIVTGRVEKAKQLMKTIAEVNKIHINNEELATFDEATLKENFNIGQADGTHGIENKERQVVKERYFHIFTSREIMKRLLVVGVIRFTCSFVYYGILLNSVWLPGDKYVNFLLSTIMSFPGEILSLYLMNKYGRKMSLMAGFYICGFLCIISAFVPAEYAWMKLSLVLLGKVIISACFTGALTYAMELFPTSVRGTLLGLGEFASRVGAMLAPLTPIMITVSERLPFIFFGFSAVLSAISLILTPETKDLPFFDTIEQIDSYGKGKPATEIYVVQNYCSVETITSQAF